MHNHSKCRLVHWVMFGPIQCINLSAQCTVLSAQCTVHTPQCSVHSAQCTVHSAQRPAFSGSLAECTGCGKRPVTVKSISCMSCRLHPSPAYTDKLARNSTAWSRAEQCRAEHISAEPSRAQHSSAWQSSAAPSQRDSNLRPHCAPSQRVTAMRCVCNIHPPVR